jgi:hypothetical protein
LIGTEAISNYNREFSAGDQIFFQQSCLQVAQQRHRSTNECWLCRSFCLVFLSQPHRLLLMKIFLRLPAKRWIFCFCGTKQVWMVSSLPAHGAYPVKSL